MFPKVLTHVFVAVRGGRKAESSDKSSKSVSSCIYASVHCQNIILHKFSLKLTMVYQRVSPDRKEQALYLLLEEGWEIERISAVFGASSRSIGRWEANYDEHGRVNPYKPIMGRPRLLDQIMKDEICGLLAEDITAA